MNRALPSLSLAFAELQTDMTDLTSDLEATGIPSLDHKTYVMKVFFPGVTEHPILQDPKVLPEAGGVHLPYLVSKSFGVSHGLY